MTIRTTIFGSWVCGVMLPLVLGCNGESGDSNAEEFGIVSAELTMVPSDVKCIQFKLTGSVSKTILGPALTAGSNSASIAIGKVPTGTVNIATNAYNVVCASITTSTEPTWTGSNVSVDVLAGTTTSVSIVLRQNLTLNANVSFQVSARSVFAGYMTSYAVLADGTVRAWGYNRYGQLGNGVSGSDADNNSANSSIPVVVSGLTGITAGYGFYYHACALSDAGVAKCWGNNSRGNLGNGTSAIANPLPVPVSGPLAFQSLSGGIYHTCGMTTSGIYCWGWNDMGQLGTGGTSTALTTAPAKSNLIGDELVPCSATTTMALAGNHSYAVGLDNAGQLGTGSINWQVTSPINTGFTAGGSRFIVAAAGGTYHFCAIEASGGNVFCSGGNSSGQLGNGTTNNSTSPVQVVGLSNATAIAASDTHSCVIKEDRTVWCWGNNADGQLGDGTGTNRSMPVQVQKLSNITGLAAGPTHTCAVKSDGTVWCWGSNSGGQLGDGTKTSRGVPVQVLL